MVRCAPNGDGTPPLGKKEIMRLSCFYREPIIPAIHDNNGPKSRYAWAAAALAIFLLMTAVSCNTEGYDTPGYDPFFRCGDKSAMADRDLTLTPSEKAPLS